MDSQQRKHILYLVTQSDYGGAQRYVFDLASSLKGKYQITVAAGPSQSEELLKKLATAQIDFKKLKYLRRAINPLFDLLGLWEIIKLIKKIKPDIIHLNSSKAGFLGALATRLLRTSNLEHQTVIYTVHGFVFLEPMNFLKKKLYVWIEKISARWKDYLITVSENDRQVGIKYKITRPEKLITIHNGIDSEKINFLPKEQSRQFLTVNYKLKAKSYKLIGTLANYYPTKGLNYLIEAAAQIIKEKPEIIFALMGDGPERKKLEQQIKQLNLEKYFILGYQENANQYLKALDIFVLPSVKEGFPYAILEAMSAELPIIASAVGGIPEIIQNNFNGILVEPKNPKILAEKIIELLKDEDKQQKIGRKALAAVKDKFSLATMVEETEKLY